MSFKVLIEGDFACFTRPEMKSERVSYDVPTPGALEGMLKSIYWKPAIRYVIDKIVVFSPISFINIRRNEVKDKIALNAVKKIMQGNDTDPYIYTNDIRTQRAAMILKNVKYGVEFHFELTGLRSEKDEDELSNNANAKKAIEAKHYEIIKRRIENGQHFRTPCLGCCEFPARSITLIDGDFNYDEISKEILDMGDKDLGYMLYRLNFEDKGEPINNDWDNPKFSDKATAEYYRPHLVNGVIDVQKYKEGIVC